jgi:hypothetical protein
VGGSPLPLTCVSLNLASAPALGFAQSYNWIVIAQRHDRFCQLPLCSLDIISQPLPTASCGSHTDAPSTLLAPGLQGLALGSALQTAFQLKNASTRWLGIFAASTPLVYTCMQSPARPSIRTCSPSTWWLAGLRCPIESSRHRQPTAFLYSRGAASRRRPSPCHPCFCQCCR